MKMIRRLPTRRMSSTTWPTGFWNCLRPQAVGTTQNSQSCAQARVASNTAWVRKCRPSSRSRRANGRLVSAKSWPWS